MSKHKVTFGAALLLFPVNILATRRFATAAAVVENAIYVVGGFDGKTYLTSGERYDPREGKWRLVSFFNA